MADSDTLEQITRELSALCGRVAELERVEADRQRLLHSLDEHKGFVESLVQNMPSIAAVTIGPDHIIQYANRAYQDVKPHVPMIGRPVREGWPELVGQGIVDILDEAYRTGRPCRLEERAVELEVDGRRVMRYWNIGYTPLTNGDRRQGVLHFAVDVTDHVRDRDMARELASKVRDINEGLVAGAIRQQRLAEEAERRARELDATLGSISDGLIITGPTGDIRRVNQAAERIMGFCAREFVAMTPEERTRVERIETPQGEPLPPREIPRERALRGETITGLHLVVHRPDGQVRHVMHSAGPIRDAEGNVIRSVTTLNDITDIVKLEQLHREVLAIVAHDIRQPLTIMLGQAQMAERSLDSNRLEVARRSISTITIGARRMNAMIEELVDGVRVESGRLQLYRQPLDLAHFIEDLLQRASASLETRRVRLSAPQDMPPASADPDRLERVVLNLVANALKYSEPETAVDVCLSRRGDKALVAVRDRGRGIDREDLPRIFDRFHRVRARQQKDSLGLGLYITRVLVEAHGGEVWAESEVGQGSTFYFTLPLV